MAGTPIHDLLRLMLDERASDMHITAGVPPVFRIDGSLVRLELPDLDASDIEEMVAAIASDYQRGKVSEDGTADFAVALEGRARFRVSCFRQRNSLAMAIRLIPDTIPTMADIGLPKSVGELTKLPRGLVLVTGPTGSGKSTTLASMLDSINSSKRGHIMTVEDPIEFVHQHKAGIINQREIGEDVPSFSEALRRTMRQDPDVILVGEMRDLETIEAAITAAETGHLVFSTLHTTGAARTVDRIVDVFPEGSKDQIRTQLAGNLRAVISQTLVPLKSGEGRIAAFEVMITTPSISTLIRENKSFRISNDILTGSKYGMVSLEASLVSLFQSGLIEYNEVVSRAQDLDLVRQLIDGETPKPAR